MKKTNCPLCEGKKITKSLSPAEKTYAVKMLRKMGLSIKQIQYLVGYKSALSVYNALNRKLSKKIFRKKSHVRHRVWSTERRKNHMCISCNSSAERKRKKINEAQVIITVIVKNTDYPVIKML